MKTALATTDRRSQLDGSDALLSRLGGELKDMEHDRCDLGHLQVSNMAMMSTHFLMTSREPVIDLVVYGSDAQSRSPLFDQVLKALFPADEVEQGHGISPRRAWSCPILVDHCRCFQSLLPSNLPVFEDCLFVCAVILSSEFECQLPTSYSLVIQFIDIEITVGSRGLNVKVGRQGFAPQLEKSIFRGKRVLGSDDLDGRVGGEEGEYMSEVLAVYRGIRLREMLLQREHIAA